jgi:hypothetical protein
MSSIDYNSLLNQNTLVTWLYSIGSNDPNPNIRTAAKEIAFEVAGSKNIQSWPYYKELYDKYKFELKVTNNINGLAVVLYSKNNGLVRLVGLVQEVKQIVPVEKGYIKPIPPSVNVESPTQNYKPSIYGISFGANTISVYIDSILNGTTKIESGINWSYTPSENLSLGIHSIKATATSEQGLVSDFSNTIEVEIQKYILPPTINFTTPTYDRTPTISGTALTSSTVTIYDDDTSIGTTTTGTGGTSGTSGVVGNWSFTPGSELTIATHIITATTTVDSNTSNPSDPKSLVISTVPVPTVNITSPTYDRTPTITGTAAASSTITVYDGASSLGTTTADGSGNWSFTPGSDLSIDTHSITATATISGQTSSASSPKTLVIQTVPSPTVSVTSPTYNRTPTISGTAIASSTITVYDGASSLGTTTADDSGNWSFTPGSNLSIDTHSITATVTISGQTSSASSPETLVIQSVSAPTVTVTSPTYNRTPTISGTAVASSTITVYDGASSLGTTTTNGSGNWSFVPSSNLSIATHSITATVTISGQTSSASSPETLVIQSVSAPTISVTSPTYNRTPTISGTAVASSTITVYDGASSLGTTTTNGSGNWSFVPSSNLSVATHSITATATISGQTSSASSPETLVINGVSSPTVTFTTPTTNRTPTISGTAIATGLIKIYDGSTYIGYSIADGSGNWSFTPNSDLSIGSHSISATTTINNQTSDPSSVQTLVVELDDILTTITNTIDAIISGL